MLDEDVAVAGQLAVIRPILDVVCQMTGMRFAALARVTDTRWVACSVRDDLGLGLDAGQELEIKTTFCDTIRANHVPILIDDVSSDALYQDHFIPRMYGFRSYISIPVTLPDGRFFGTLCALDADPARVTKPGVLGMFELFARLIGEHLQAHERLMLSEASLADERRLAVLREQFIAVLGHDLRAPLGSIMAGTAVLRRTPLEPRAAGVLGLMEQSTKRMAGLVNNILDFARGRLGGGIQLQRVPNPHLGAELEHVLGELRAGRPDRLIDSRICLATVVDCDSERIAQLLSNLVANALTHGDPTQPVRVSLTSDETAFRIEVINAGESIPPEVRTALFQPFNRSAADPNAQGLGLGLFIVAEIARAHGGEVAVESQDGLTRFAFCLPAGRA